ncbi:rhodanese [Sphingomonas aliaeris]|uniref:Rhodanese n=1 Tax=Sphingomonas aliaeris TaxID=2759526 RepID=A0A974S4I7_9SPHN|nr:rhodanese-like domain-containing protein [Sphingomonas aliaeris]QQV77546.1 rhodanese [Sphingomonas aliaeris]
MKTAAALLLVIATSASAQDAPLFDPVTGYRLTAYRGVVDSVPEGVVRIDARQAAALRGKAVFLDVTPAEGAVRDAEGTWRLAMPHATIPGAHWYPEAGRGIQPAGIGAWFADGVKRLTRGRRDTRVVVFCLADCWMSWNAARRLRRAGYTRINWFSEGLDGWKESGRTLADARPDR